MPPIAFGDLPGTTPQAVLLAVRSRVVAFTEMDDAYCFLTLDDDASLDEAPTSGAFVAVRPGRSPFDRAKMAGGGRSLMLVTMDVEVVYFAALNVDQRGRAGAVLTDATLGILAQFWRVLDALALYYPPGANDDAAKSLFVEPMRPLYADVMPRKANQRRYRLSSRWEVKFNWNPDSTA